MYEIYHKQIQILILMSDILIQHAIQLARPSRLAIA